MFNDNSQTGGIIALAQYSNVFITDSNIRYTNIQQICRQHAIAGGINGQLMYSNSKVINVKISNSIITCKSSNLNTHTGGINAAIEQTNDYQQNNVIYDLQVISTSVQGGTHSGGLNGYNSYSTINISSVKVIYLNQQIRGNINYCGGLLGIVVYSTQVNIFSSSVAYSNFTLNAKYYNEIGVAIGKLFETQTTILNDVVISHIIHVIEGNCSSTGAFLGNIYSSNQQLRTQTQIYNSLIDSINIYSTTQYNFNNLISQCPNSAFGQIQISQTKSLGFSSINGVTIPNCEKVQVQQLGGNYYISDSGCI
ncbi:Hypothetical_protein [Hexamita inflata]|nr:Hypothetical protein HINF_LOCUS10366 [Hexamita inflata]